jgi:hypothetical protein
VLAGAVVKRFPEIEEKIKMQRFELDIARE